ncbi:MAG: YciI family protein [Helicobacter sp.]|nr:YciI family protein [Helicobacteraceae bacterium]MDY3113635.1 YciI family protein [Helicobacter sp.]
MKNLFVIRVTYTKPFEEIEKILPRHREFLQSGYKSGNLVASGPQNPKVGGIIIGTFSTKDEAESFFKDDPYALESLATYEIIEFSPVLHCDALKEFLK